MNFWNNLNKPILALAPMEGVTDSPFRATAKEFGADVVYTEFLSADAIAYGAPKVLAKMAFAEMERPIVCQIFGRDPEKFAVAAKKVEALGFDGLDINFGCPARKVVSHGSGVALLRQPEYARRLVESALSSTTLPVSIKVRTSIRKEARQVDPNCTDRYTALDLLAALEDLPLAAIMVHGRSFEQGHSGDVDAAMIQQIKQKFSGIVLANGGIYSPEDAVRMLTATGADGVGIARGAWGRPWIFQQTQQLIDQAAWQEVTVKTRAAAILAHAERMNELSQTHGLIEFRKHLAKYIRGQVNAAELRQQAVRVSSVADVERVLAALIP